MLSVVWVKYHIQNLPWSQYSFWLTWRSNASGTSHNSDPAPKWCFFFSFPLKRIQKKGLSLSFLFFSLNSGPLLQLLDCQKKYLSKPTKMSQSKETIALEKWKQLNWKIKKATTHLETRIKKDSSLSSLMLQISLSTTIIDTNTPSME